jgi:Spy/CpxP family protein refolding chaperone
MKTQKLLLTSILTISVFGLFGAVLASGLLPTTASAGGLLMAHNHGGHGGWGRHCGADQEHAAELIHAFVSIRLDLDEAQESALDEVVGVVDRWHRDLPVCEHPAFADAPAALAALNEVVDQTGAAMAELQPAFAAFYAALTPEQQERLNSWLRHHHGSET